MRDFVLSNFIFENNYCRFVLLFPSLSVFKKEGEPRVDNIFYDDDDVVIMIHDDD